MPAGRKYRFFYHFNKQTRKMTVHFKGVCYPLVEHINCLVPCQTHYNKRQPYLVMRGWAAKVDLIGHSGHYNATIQ